ncbi:MAG TPA: nitrogen regulation protein NR(I) [Gammaproteobacteria bacterium]|nr:nitrogen regulation protein NR(I) [Gammaproteobacteria bacterium]
MNNNPHDVWIVDDDPSLRLVMSEALSDAGYRVRSLVSAEDMREALAGSRPDVLVTDIRLPGEDGLALLRTLRTDHPSLPVIVVTAHSDLGSTVAAYEGGAFEYLPKPFDLDELVALVARAAQTVTKKDVRTPGAHEPVTQDVLVGEAPAMQSVFRAIGRLAKSSVSVLITGESGSGKELVARALHRHSPRANRPFVALNTAAIPAELLESELFGHERGAFTGATARRIGRFEQAHGATLFLDEIGDMSAALQTRLLRVLAEGEFFRVGGHEPVKVDVRILAATHQDLQARVKAGQFREDLYHRLNVMHIQVPPLRDRRDDIPQLLDLFMSKAAQELACEPKRLTADAMQLLRDRIWSGNVRELRNVCRRLTLMAPGRIIHRGDLTTLLGENSDARAATESWGTSLRTWARAQLATGQAGIFERASSELERILIEEALRQTDGHRQHAARLLGVGRNTLTRKLQGQRD